MRKFLLFLGYLLSAFLLFMACDFGLGAIFDRYLFLDNDPKMLYAHQGGGGEDLVVLGASRASHHYCPSVFEDRLGFKCYNYGMDGRNIFNQYIVADEILSNSLKKPHIVILEVASIDIMNSPNYNGEKLSNLYVLYKRNKSVRDIIDIENPEKTFVLQNISIYRYNSRLLGYLKRILAIDSNNLNGYEPLYKQWGEDVERKDDTNVDFYPEKEYYLRRLIEYFLTSGVKLFVFNSPEYYVFENRIPWEDKVESICKEYNVPFINHAHDVLFLAHREWFNEPFHLNDMGAKAYSEIVVNDINHYLQNK